MNTMQEAWRDYRDRCYPKGIEGIQNRECHQAFFSGALVAIEAMMDISNNTTDDSKAVKAVDRLLSEVLSVCQARANTLKDRN
jgi:hypothetical protein